jgi:hypothetical protein
MSKSFTLPKSIIDEYMRRLNYPFDEGKKIGFNAAKNLL